MKILSTLAIMFILSEPVVAEEYVLDKIDYLPPVGSVIKTQLQMNMLDAKLKLNTKDQLIDGTMQTTMSKIETHTILTPSKYRSLLEHKVATGKVNFGENDMPHPEKVEALINIPVIMELKDGKWFATPEKGKFTTEEQEDVDKLVKKANQKASMYGYAPKKVGDIWDVELPALKEILNDDDLTKGSATVRFMGAEMLEGELYAELVVVFDVEGIKENELLQKTKGEMAVIRNLRYFLDTKANGKMDVFLEGEVRPGTTMKIEADSFIDVEVSIKAPVEK